MGAVPIYFRHGSTPIVSLFPIGALVPRLLFYVGLTALSLAWLQLGRLTLRSAPGTGWRALRRIALRWAAPLVFAIPLASRDLWAYAAQSQLMVHHLNPYSLGPSALPGAFSVEVSHRWVDTPAPYGPLWLLTGKLMADGIGQHVGMTVAALRLLAVIGLVLLTYAVGPLADRAGGRRNVAIWLIIANPLTLIMGLGGGHNDLLMVGLMAAGLAIVTGPGSVLRSLVLGTGVLTLAVAVKSPSAVALAFAVPLWLIHAPSGQAARAKRGTGYAITIVGFGSVGLFTVITLISGLGLGWVKQVNSSASVVSWMSLPTFAAIIWDLITGHLHNILKLDAQMSDFRTAGTVISIMLLAALWLVAMRPFRSRLTGSRLIPWSASGSPASGSPAPRWSLSRDAWMLLAIALLTVVLLGPSVQPWYFIWALSIAGAARLPRRAVSVIAGLSLGMVAMVRPNGVGLQMNPFVALILGLSLVLALTLLEPARTAEPKPKPKPETEPV